MSAVFLPFSDDGRPDLEAFSTHLALTVGAGLTPAVNMDTGFGPELGPEKRREILDLVADVLPEATSFVAGCLPFGDGDEDGDAYVRAATEIAAAGGTPIVFPSPWLGAQDGVGVVALHERVLSAAPTALAFELGEQFVPFGRIYDLATVEALMALPGLVGMKHSSLSRAAEFERLDLRDRVRPDFRVYTGNDLAIDMVRYGSDYLLGLSTFDPRAFAQRDAWWEAGDERVLALDDALQALGTVTFRRPVPAYKDSAATYLRLTGRMPAGTHPHPRCTRRPDGELELLAPIADSIAAAMSA